MRDRRSIVAGAVLAAGAWAVPAAADEAKTPVSASMLLNIMSTPVVESRATAYDESIKDPGSSPRSPLDGVVQPDGSVKFGGGPASVSVTVKNPCPPGTLHYEPPPLPGRRARR